SNPSPFSTHYPSAAGLASLLERHGFESSVFGAFPVEAASSRDRVLAPIRHFAVRYHLIPSSMHAKALVKRVLYGRLPALGAVHEGMRENATGEMILDCGRGSEHSSNESAKFAKHVTGIDISPEAVRLAQEHAEAAGVADKTTFVVMDAEALTFEPGSFDVVSVR